MFLLMASTPPAIFSKATMVAQTQSGEQGENAEHGENGESNDMRADLRGILKIEDAAEVTSEGEKVGAAATAACSQAATEWPDVRSTLMQNGASHVQLARVDVAIANLKHSIA